MTSNSEEFPGFDPETLAMFAEIEKSTLNSRPDSSMSGKTLMTVVALPEQFCLLPGETPTDAHRRIQRLGQVINKLTDPKNIDKTLGELDKGE